MKMIILAAGQGTRLKPLTENKPKCMVQYNNKAIIDYTLDLADDFLIKDIIIINGYKKEVLKSYLIDRSVKFRTNHNYLNTNMVNSLFCAKDFMDDDIIVSYSDIIYEKKVLKSLIDSKNDVSVIIDKNWKFLWSLRMKNPLSDLETLKIKDGKIIEIGLKPKNYSQVEGQYIGLVKFSKKIIKRVKEYYLKLDKSKLYNGNNFNNMYLTTFLQLLADNLVDIKPVFINGGWIEIDSLEDLEKYKREGIIF